MGVAIVSPRKMKLVISVRLINFPLESEKRVAGTREKVKMQRHPSFLLTVGYSANHNSFTLAS
jgi:hypothetical protein